MASGKKFDRPALVVGILLFVAAGVTAFDASRLKAGFTYGISPAAMPYVVSVFLALLGIGHFISAFREGLPEPDEADWKAFGWVSGGLLALIACIWLGAGFVLGSTLLFAFTARAFGRKAIVADLAIGFVLSLLVFLLFNNLLTLTLPEGPLERLF
ncbi:tripartite tricarboxylate transporter TctB family protein [Aurantimonas sp. Leaf443]|uniref:tripartite tricarboxylate transporter TctB family protein n=1 Tax=Aurantimonas sp. Leaf443 TaxID=1736378 RepID=UPI000AA513F4|nr:tripartite tricarboxylate transporter TctB family protein [Aurantimonas sp. Leaf443]